MVNLFADMGVQPRTLQSGLIAGHRLDGHHRADLHDQLAAGGASLTEGQRSRSPARPPTVGGVIAGVEVSTDGGATWHPATGDENWTYTWSPQVAGTYTIMSRAVDDSINLETPSAGRTVTVTGPTILRLFPPSARPPS